MVKLLKYQGSMSSDFQWAVTCLHLNYNALTLIILIVTNRKINITTDEISLAGNITIKDAGKDDKNHQDNTVKSMLNVNSIITFKVMIQRHVYQSSWRQEI